MKTSIQTSTLQLFIITIISIASHGLHAQIGTISGATEVCLNSSATYTTDFTLIPEGERIFHYKWTVEKGKITQINFIDGTSSSQNASELFYAAMTEPNPFPVPTSFTIQWDEEGEGSVRLEIETTGLATGNLIFLTTLFDSTLPVTVLSTTDGEITSVSEYIVCDENDIVTLTGNNGSADLGSWNFDNNMTCSDCFGNVVKVSPKPGFEGYMTATFQVACGLTWYDVDEVSIWVGPPSTPVITLSNDEDCLEAGTSNFVFVTSEGADSYSWSIPDCNTHQTIDNLNPDCWFSYDGEDADTQNEIYVGSNDGSISVWASNECGETSSHINVEICENVIGPNPTGGNTTPNAKNNIRIPFTESSEDSDTRQSNESNSIITVYPNPIVDNIQIHIDINEAVDYRYQLLSIDSKLLLQGMITEEKTTIKTENLNRGMYFLHVYHYNKLVATKKIMK